MTGPYPQWHSANLRDASLELEDILSETHGESDAYAPIARAIEAIQDADIALERARVK